MNKVSGLIWIIGGAAVAVFLTALLWPSLLESSAWIRPSGRVTLAGWLKDFRTWGLVGVFVGSSLALFWYLMGEFVWKIVTGGIVALWYILALLALAAGIVPAVFLLPAAQNQWGAYGLYFLNFLLVYYAPTLFGPPATLACIPPGWQPMRK